MEKEIKPGSYKDRLASAPDNKNMKILTEDEIEEIAKNRNKPGLEAKMLKNEDKIFTNIYGANSTEIDAAIRRSKGLG